MTITLPVEAEGVYVLFIFGSLMLAAKGVWMLVDAIRVPDGQYRAGGRAVWVLVIVFTGLIGALLYQFVGRPRVA